ncbi:uncharacterized protein [Aegilops tauschii subsp. strangulata]|uniref:uncharacterized protein n=1 Tax=Aegilops tauschii subsp. strangulata TaxID=200361 RepID=UPI003CC8D47A
MVVHEEGEIMPTGHDSTMEVFMDLTLLHCSLCLRPMKPPVYKCKGGHLACVDYRGERLENQWQCQKCERGGGFTGPPPALPHHISTVHPKPVHRIQYDKVLQLQVPVLEPWRLLFAEDDDCAFFMLGDTLNIGAPIVMPVVYIRAGVFPPPHYTTKVWANGPPGAPKGRTDVVKVEIEVTSSKEPDTIAVEELAFFTVPPKLLVRAVLSRTVSLHIQIDKLTY